MPPAKQTRRQFGRIQRLPSGRWRARFTDPDTGRLHNAPKTYATKIDAEAWLTDRRREIDRGLWNPDAAADETADRKLTFAEYATTFLAHRTVKGRLLRPRTREHYEKLLEVHILPTFGALPLASITTKDVRTWHRTLAPDLPTTRAHAYSLFSTICNAAVADEAGLKANPCTIKGAGQSPPAKKREPASLAELEVIVDNTPPRFRAMVLLGAWTALRYGELAELRRSDVDIVRAVVKVRRGAVRLKTGIAAGPTKSDAGARDVAIPPHLLPSIERHLAEHVRPQRDSLLFPADHGGHLSTGTMARWWGKARAAAGREDLRFHDLRHTGAVLAAQTGATLAELMARLGHSTPAAAMRYQHAAQGRDRHIAEALSNMTTIGKK